MNVRELRELLEKIEGFDECEVRTDDGKPILKVDTDGKGIIYLITEEEDQ